MARITASPQAPPNVGGARFNGLDDAIVWAVTKRSHLNAAALKEVPPDYVDERLAHAGERARKGNAWPYVAVSGSPLIPPSLAQQADSAPASAVGALVALLERPLVATLAELAKRSLIHGCNAVTEAGVMGRLAALASPFLTVSPDGKRSRSYDDSRPLRVYVRRNRKTGGAMLSYAPADMVGSVTTSAKSATGRTVPETLPGDIFA